MIFEQEEKMGARGSLYSPNSRAWLSLIALVSLSYNVRSSCPYAPAPNLPCED